MQITRYTDTFIVRIGILIRPYTFRCTEKEKLMYIGILQELLFGAFPSGKICGRNGEPVRFSGMEMEVCAYRRQSLLVKRHFFYLASFQIVRFGAVPFDFGERQRGGPDFFLGDLRLRVVFAARRQAEQSCQ